MRRIQKYLSGLCAAALLLSLLLAGTAKADEITIYLMAENDQMLFGIWLKSMEDRL